MPGWKTKTSGITSYDELPEAAKNYVRRIEELCGAPVAMISTGPERTETIIREGSPVSEWMK
jgi:adenylosuccinate synthase